MKFLSKKYYFTIIELLVTISIIGILAAMLLPQLSKAQKRAHRISSNNNLRQIFYALYLYSDRYSGNFPDGDNAVGLSKLEPFLTSPATLIAPGTSTSPSAVWSTGMACSYAYKGGYRVDDDTDSGIAGDKEGNYTDYGNILFSNGKVEGFSGSDWKTNANNPDLEPLF